MRRGSLARRHTFPKVRFFGGRTGLDCWIWPYRQGAPHSFLKALNNDQLGQVKPAEVLLQLLLLPRLDLAVAITVGNYDAPDQARPPTAVLRDLLLSRKPAG